MRKKIVPHQTKASPHVTAGAGGPKFKSWASEIGHTVADGSPPLRHFFERSCVAQTAMTWGWAVPTLCTLRRNTTSIKQKLKRE